jgi:protein YIPF1/2
LSLTTYQQYFDVDTVQVVDRLRRALSVKNEMFFENDMRPDMYGPFWLCTTLVFVMAAAGNLGSLLSFVPSEDEQVFTYNFSKLTVATSLLYGYCLVVPVTGWFASKLLMTEPFSLTELICIYGYSLAVYVPAAILCVLPMEILRWAIIAGAFIVSLKFITRNVRDVVIRQLDEARALMILVIVTALHGSLALFLKIYFYS